MANEEHIAQLRRGVVSWNAWRNENPDIHPDLSGADLSRANLNGADLHGANLVSADLRQANLIKANLRQANLVSADLRQAKLIEANLGGLKGRRSEALNVGGAFLRQANLAGADLRQANLIKADLIDANLAGAILAAADLDGATLLDANLSGADLCGADLTHAVLADTNLTDADLTGCRVYGGAAWNLTLDGAKQQDLIITPEKEPNKITVDNIEVAQFIYLLLHNQKIREAIDTIGRKAVLILGRFTKERKAVLDALRDELRKRNYLPILFDFDKPASQDLTATVSTLAHLARFIIADITDPSSIPYELATVVPTTPVPVQPILLSGSSEFAMFPDLRRRHHWVLTTHYYDSQTQLIADLGEKVIGPAELKVQDLRGRAGQA